MANEIKYNSSGTILKNTSNQLLLNLSIGSFYQGGRVFNISGETIWIISTDDVGYKWGCTGSTAAYSAAFPDDNNRAVGDGLNNTNLITGITCIDYEYAAKWCKEYTGGGYNDWWLPSYDELHLAWDVRTDIGWVGGNHWTSSFGNGTTRSPVLLLYSTSNPITVGVQFSNKVRAVRIGT